MNNKTVKANDDLNGEEVSNRYNKNRDVKIHKIEHNKIQQDIDLAIEYKKSNRLRNDHKKEIFNKGYKLKTLIGSGAFAHVFKAKDLKTGKEVAVKLIELEKCTKHYKNVCLPNEINVIRELNHESIVKFLEAFNTALAYVMIMEFVDNGSFADLLYKNGPIGDYRAKTLFRGVFNGVEYMHKRLIAHRDLKLENLLLNKNNEPKIVDFSLSVIWDGKRLLSDWCGTPPYFAPEILSRKPYNPLSYDVWTLGVCLFIMLNDNIPFLCFDEQEMLNKQLNRQYKFRTKLEKNISTELKNIVGQMLEPEMSIRISISNVNNQLNQLNQSKWLQTKPNKSK